MPLILPGNVGSATASTGFNVDNSLRFNNGFDGNADDAYMHRTPSSAGNRRTFTLSAWIKRGAYFNDEHPILAADTTSAIRFSSEGGSNSKINIYYYSGGWVYRVHTNAEYRDPSAWMHLVVAFDTTQATASNRIKIYVNGTQVTSMGNSDYPSENYDTAFNNNVLHTIGRNGTAGDYYEGYLSEVVMIDGQALTPTSFGEFDEDSGIWKPKDVSDLTFGTNGFYLDFEDSSNLGNDASGGTDFTEVNLAATDQSTDTCTNNFATWNSLQPTNAAMSEGNLVGASSASSGHYSGISSIGVSSGKWYFECKQTQESTANEGMIGVIIFYNTITALLNPVGRGGGWGMQDGNRGFSTDSGGSGSTTDNFHAGWTDDDIIGIALDIDNSRVYYSKNGQWNNSGSWNAANPTTSQTLQNALGDGTYFFMAGDASGSNNCTWSANFGSPAHAISSGNTDGNGYGNFEYAVPSGYFSLNTKNLAKYG